MNEIKKAIAILQTRGSETALLIGLFLVSHSAVQMLISKAGEKASKQDFLLAIFGAVLGIFVTLLRLGFIRTICLDPQTPQSNIVLLKTGCRFFWRMFFLGLLYLGVFLIAMFLKNIFVPTTAPPEQSDASATALSYLFFFCVVNFLLVKFIILLPALVIARDCRVFESFALLRQFKLSDAKPLIALFCVLFGFTFAWQLLPTPNDDAAILIYIMHIVPTAISFLINLIIAVMAVRFVSSASIVYDEPVSDPELIDENEPKEPWLED